MALNIKNPHTHESIKELAERTGTSQAAAVDIAVQERLERVRQTSHSRRYEQLWDAIEAIAPRARQVLGEHDHGEWLYDDDGLPK